MVEQELQVKDLGEQGLLARLQAFCPANIIGDDGAVLSLDPRALVVTTDLLVEGVHFSDHTTSPQDVGWRAVAANLSDLAAMGADPVAITVGLAMPPTTSVRWLEGLYEGMTECLQGFDTPIVGGDVCRSSGVTVAITAFGQVEPDRVIRRSQAVVGDVIVATGVHGAARAGLELLLHPEQGEGLSGRERERLIRAHQRPLPRLDVLPIMRDLLGGEGGNQTGRMIAGMDSSDGLADAISQICRASGVGAEVDADQIPAPAPLKKWVSPETALEWALYGGEDFELVLCLPPLLGEQLVKELKNGAAIVGKITRGTEVWLRSARSNIFGQQLTFHQSFQHF